MSASSSAASSSTTLTEAAQNLVGQTIDNGRIYFHSILGSGSFGIVMHSYRVSDWKSAPQEYAVKCISKLTTAKEQLLIMHEIEIHKRASGHPGIVTLHQVLEDEKWFYLILDYCPTGDLFKEIVHARRYYGNDPLIRSVFLQLLDAVEYCHSQSIFHRDLKPENVMVLDDGQRTLLMDFGLATNSPWCIEWGCGSGFYMSPEIYGQGRIPYSAAAADIWSLGVILVNLVTGRNPWRRALPGDGVYDLFLRDPDALLKVLPISGGLNDLLKRIFVEPTYRPTIPQIRQAIMHIDHFLASDPPAMQSWQETLDRDRDALQTKMLKRPLRRVQRGAVLRRTTASHEGVIAPFQLREPAQDSPVEETPARILVSNASNSTWSSEISHRWSGGQPPSHPTSAHSSSNDSHSRFPVTPQMPSNCPPHTVAADDWHQLSSSQFNRRTSIRRKLFAQQTHEDAGASSQLAGHLPRGATMEDLTEAERASGHVPIRQKMKQLMHKSMRALNSRDVRVD